MHSLIGLRYRVQAEGWDVGELLTWIVRNMDYVVVPSDVDRDGILSFSNAVHWLCKSLDKSCIETLYEHYKGNIDNTVRPVKTIYAVGHGIFIWIDINVKVNEDGVYPMASGIAYVMVDTYGQFNQVQRELTAFIKRMPESIKPA